MSLQGPGIAVRLVEIQMLRMNSKIPLDDLGLSAGSSFRMMVRASPDGTNAWYWPVYDSVYPNVDMAEWAIVSLSNNNDDEIPELSITPDSRTVSDSSGTTTFGVDNTGTGDMLWTASVVSGEDWLSISSGSSGTNSGTVSLEFLANDTGSFRTGTIRVAASGTDGSPMDVTVLQSRVPYLMQ